MSKLIPLRNKAKEAIAYAIVDDEDFDQMMRFRWHLTSEGYAESCQYQGKGHRNRLVRMHRMILNVPSGIQVDHINLNGLDNRRSNLRICTNAQNSMNKPKRNQATSSRFKGVCWSEKSQKWRVHIFVNGRQICLGRYSTEIEAAQIYDRAAIHHFGEFARLNFPVEDDIALPPKVA